MMTRRLRSPANDDHGAAAIELALVLPILILLLGGIVDFGFAFNAQISATHAAREGVRAAALEQDDPEGVAAAAFSAPVATASPSLTSGCGSGAEQARMQVTATYDPFFFFLNTMNLESEAVMRCGG
jgi:Flp pilus assembly protein TadG